MKPGKEKLFVKKIVEIRWSWQNIEPKVSTWKRVVGVLATNKVVLLSYWQ